MYRVLIVDDEADVRDGIEMEIDWAASGFELAGKAENGREALEMVEKLVPDLVLTDIKMPFMDGLALTEAVRSRFPSVRIVILTGFDEFEFAQRAIKLHVLEYLLKPFSTHELAEVLARVRSTMDEERREREDIDKLRRHYSESLPVMKEKFLVSLLGGRMTLQEILEKSARFGLPFAPVRGVAAVIGIDTALPESSVTLPEQHLFRLPEEMDLAVFAVNNLAGEMLESHNRGVCFTHEGQIILLMPVTMREDALMADILPMLEEIRRAVHKFLRLTVTVGVGHISADMSGLPASYADARSALEYRLVLGGDRVILIDDVEPLGEHRFQLEEADEHALTSTLKVGTPEEMTAVLEQLFARLHAARVTVKDSQIYLLDIISTLLKAARNAGVDVSALFGDDFNLFSELSRFTDMDALRIWMQDICTRMMGDIKRDRQDTHKQISEAAKAFIRNNYGNGDLNINMVCGQLHISPAYLSLILKKEARTTFVNYLTQVRMDAAREFLRTTDMKAFEIAEKIGYADANYFSFCFKKNQGMSPSEYRSKQGGQA